MALVVLRSIRPCNARLMSVFSIAVPPSKPVIRLADTGHSVEGYLGPYQIGTKLALVCQVNVGKKRRVKTEEGRGERGPVYVGVHTVDWAMGS